MAISEVLEERLVLAAVGVTYDGAGTLTLIATPGATNEVVTVKAGAAFTDVLVKGQVTTRILDANSSNITTINFTAGGGTKDSLSVSGIANGGTLTINTTDLEKLQINASNNVTVDSDTASAATLNLVTSTISGTLTLAHEGDITQSGKMLVSGTTTITALDGATPKDINLKTSSNSFGTLALSGDNVTVKEAGPTDLGSSTATGDLKVTSSGAITSTALTVGGVATFTSNGSTITVTGAFADDIVLTKGTNISVTDTNGDTELGKTTATGTLFVRSSAGDILNSGKLTVGGLATFRADGNGGLNANDGDITLTGSNNFGSLSLFGTNATVNEKSSTDLATSTLEGFLTVTSAGAITDSGKLDVTDALTLTTNGSAITLDRTDSVFGDALILTGTAISIRDNDADTLLGNVTAKGNFTLRSTGDVTQSGSLTVSGRMTVTARDATDDDQDITLTGPSNRVGSVSLFGEDVQFTEADATDVFTTMATGLFTLISSGPVTDSGVITVTDITTITATDNSVTLDNEDSAFNDRINLTASNATIYNSLETKLGSVTVTSNLTLFSVGDVSQTTGTTISVTGRLTIDDDDNDIDVDLGAAAGDATVLNLGSLSLFILGDATITEDSATDLFTSVIGGDLTLISKGVVTDSGDLTISGDLDVKADDAGTKDITLNSVNSTFDGAIKLNGANVSIYNDTASDIGTTTTTGTLTVTSAGDITDSGVISVGGKATFDAQGDDITLNEAGIDFNGSLALFGDNVMVTTGAATGALDLATSTISGNLTLIVDGDVSDSGTIRVDGIASISVNTPATQDIVLNSALNQFDSLILSANDITINEFGDTVLASVTATGDFTLTSSGGITDTGSLSIIGAASLTASGGNLTLDTAASTFGSVSLIGDNIVFFETGDTDLDLVSTPGTFALTSTGQLTQSGSVSVGDHATLTVTGSITLAQDGDATLADDTIKNNFGSLVFTGTTVTIHESSDTLLSPSLTQTTSASGVLTIKSLGSITANGIVTVGSTTDLTAGAAGTEVITLNNASNEFGELRLAGGVVTITDNNTGANETEIGTSTVGTLHLTSDTDVSRAAGSGAFTVADLLSIVATGKDVDFRTNGGANNFGMISIEAHDVTITESSGTIIDFLDLTGDLDLISGGDVTGNTVDIEIDGTTTINAAGFDINIDPTFGGAVNLTADDIVLIALGNLTLGDITATGDVDITTTTDASNPIGNVTNGTTGTLDIDGVLTINAGSSAVTINIRDTDSNLSNPLVVNTTGTITTTIPTAAFTISVTADDTVNISEAAGMVTISGTVTTTGGVEVGDTLRITLVDGANTASTYTGTVLAGGAFSIDVDGSKLVSDADYTLEISVPHFGTYTPSGTKSYSVDVTAPTVAITPLATDVSVAGGFPQTITFTFTFSETVTGFTASDIVVAVTGTATATRLDGTFAGGGAVYTIDVRVDGGTAGAGNTVTVNVGAAAAQDVAGNDSTAAPAQGVITLIA